MRRFCTLLLFIPLWIQTALADQVIRGRVLSSEDKEPLISVTVSVKPELLKAAGITKPVGSLTDYDGNFTLTLPDQIKEVQLNYVGFETFRLVLEKGKRDYTIIMKPSAIELEGVVVTGYQRIERRKLTAAVAKIDISDEMIGSVKSIDQALSGQVAGLSAMATSGAPGAPMKIRIRGTSSLNGTQDPLWVLDGIPLEGTDIPKMEELKDVENIYNSSIAGINPSDIESITVLKDAAATAIYGARAANGVIVITTKSGKKGKAKVNFSTKLSYVPNLSISDLNLLNSNEKVDLELGLLRSDYTYRENKGGVAQILAQYGQTDLYKQSGWDALSGDTQREINALRDINTPWNDLLFRDAFNQEYNVSVSGGNDFATYYTSLGFYDEKGNVRGVDAQRLNLTAKTDYQFNKYLKVGASVFASQRKNTSFLSDYNGFTNPVYYSRRANPYAQIYDANGNYIYDRNIQGQGDETLDFNVIEEQRNTSNVSTIQSISTIFNAELKLTNDLKFNTQLGYQNDYSSSEKIADEESFVMRKDKLRSTRLINGVSQSFLPNGGFHKQNETRQSQITWKAMGEYRHEWNNRHELEAMVGTEIRKSYYQTLFSAGYGFNRETLTTKPVIFPKEEDATAFPLHQKTYQENAYVSAFSTLSYSLLKRYTLGGSIRFDGSDLFGVDKRYRYLPLYSVSGVWRITGEEFMEDIDWLNNWSVRASYGLQGNIDKNTSPYVMGNYKPAELLPGGSENSIVISSPPNDKLRWEKTQNINAGTDISLLNQAINLSVDYYYRLSSDLISIQMLPLESGFTSTTINWAQMTNQGVEVSLATRNIHTKQFMWTTSFNIGYNANKINQVSTPANQQTPSLEGYSVGSIFAYRYGGLDNEGYPLFINNEGNRVTAKELFGLQLVGQDVSTSLTPEQQRNLYYYAGTSEPIVSGGMTNNFTYKNWELGVNFIFNLGHMVRVAPSYSPTRYDRGLNTNRDILDRWTPENTNTLLPALMNDSKRKEEYYGFLNYNYDRSFDLWVKRGDYIRLQSVRLGYRLPETWLKKLHIGEASLAVEGRNLWAWGADYKNYLDPETMGNEFAQPIPRTITFMLNLSF